PLEWSARSRPTLARHQPTGISAWDIWERGLMFGTFVVMAAIEISLFIDKPHARVFAVTILAVGLVLRGLASERAAKKRRAAAPPDAVAVALPPQDRPAPASLDPLLCAVRGVGRTLDFAIEEAKETERR